MDEKIYGVLLEILEELKFLNGRKKEKKFLTTEQKIEKFVEYILNFESNGLSKADLRASKIVSNPLFKSFWDNNQAKIIEIMKTRHNIFLSRCVEGYYLYKKPLKIDIGD